jgi:molybdopterin converting factor small subunit
MKVKVKYLTPIKNAVGRNEESFEFVPATSIAHLVEEITERYGSGFSNYLVASEDGALTTKKVNIGIQRDGIIGTKRIELLNGFDTPLKDQDLVLFYSPQA